MSKLSEAEPKESPAELRARRLLTEVLSIRFEKVKESNEPHQKSVDYRSVGNDPEHVVEVKEVVGEESRSANAAVSSAHFLSEKLTCQWTAVIETPVISEALNAPPQFRDPNPEEARESHARGFRILSAEERRLEWRAEHPVHRPVPRLRKLGRRLEPCLLVLEEHGVYETLGRSLWTEQDREVAEALRNIAKLTGDTVCQGTPVPPGRHGSVRVQRAWRYLRTGDPNTLVDRIEAWFEAGLGENLIESLANEAEAVRHAVLVFDSTEPEIEAAIQQGMSFCPSVPPALPDVIEVLWLILGPVGCRFIVGEGWSSYPAPSVGNGATLC
jgi:hypothetical protein